MSKTQRLITLVLAVLFLATTIGFTIAVIADIRQTNESAVSTEVTGQGQEDVLQARNLEGFTPVDKVENLQIIDLRKGTGEVVPAGATVLAHYTGAVASTGRIFQSSHDFGQPLSFGLNEVIAGWTEGVPGMQVGGKRRLLVPAVKAYGEQSPSPDIPANADLVFDIEIIAIER